MIFAPLFLVPVRAGPLPEVNYTLRTWTTDDGLPHNSTSRALQDRAGFMWFGTVGGLARFDGRQFREIKLPAEYQRTGLNIRGFAEEKPGTLLVLSTSGHVLRLTDGQVSVHPSTAKAQELGEDPLDVYIEPSGVVWLGTHGGHLLRWQPDGQAKIFRRSPPLTQRSKRFTFAADDTGATWIGHDDMLAVFRNGELHRHERALAGSILVAQGRGGLVWVCTETQLLRLERGQLAVAGEPVPWHDNFASVRHLCEDSEGHVWVTSRRGLFRFARGGFQRVPTPYSIISFVTEDREGNLWVATDGSGVGQLREKSYTVFNEDNGLRQDGVSAISEDPAGRIFAANRGGGIVELATALRETHRIALPEPRLPVDTVLADKSGRFWFGGLRTGLWRLDPGVSPVPEKLPRPSAGLQVLFAARNGDIWFASLDNTLGRYRIGEPEYFSLEQGYEPQEIQAIAEDAAGHIWLGGRRGELLRWDGVRFTRQAAAEISHPIHFIHADLSDNLWIATASGMVLKDGARFQALTREHGLPDEIIHQLLEDDHGRLWLAARRGLFYVVKADLLAAARGGTSPAVSHHFGQDQGLRGFTPTANYQPAACKGSDGRLWFATTQGAIVVDPSNLRREFPPPPLLIDAVRLDGNAIGLGLRTRSADPLRFPSGRHRVEFRFAALSYTSPESVSVRHLLEGIDHDWIEAGSDRTASYTNLPPGGYRLRAIARNSVGPWSPVETIFAFTIVPAWWETLSARFAAILLLVGATAWLARTVSQRRLQGRLQRLEQAHALEKERARIARDLHDDLGASLTEIGLLADRLVPAVAPDLGPQLSGLAWRTRRLATDLSSIVWTMSGKNTPCKVWRNSSASIPNACFATPTSIASSKVRSRFPPRPLLPTSSTSCSRRQKRRSTM
ncbi:MAG: triple tyrosine motif-containing protein [Opitutaceae bacterium]